MDDSGLTLWTQRRGSGLDAKLLQILPDRLSSGSREVAARGFDVPGPASIVRH